MSDEEDDDWFERAVREMDEESAEGDDQDAEDDATPADGEADATGDEETGGEETEGDETGTGSESPRSISDAESRDPDDGADDGGGTFDGDAFGDEDAGGFGEDAADSAFGGDEGGDAFGSDEGDAPFGGDDFDGDAGDFGGGEGGGDFGGDEFDAESFGGGFGDAEFGDEDGDDFGFADFGGDEGGTDFDEAEFDSDIDRVDVGIEGLDEMILGGVPDRSLMVAIGSAGTGKTTFGLQFLHQALRNDRKGVYITLEESREAILSTAEEKGWPFREYVENDQLAVVALDPIEMANSLSSIRSDISRLVGDFGADRLVLDSVSLLEMMYDHPAKRRSEVFDFARSLKRAGVTTMLTSEASEENAYTSRYGIVEYLVDAVFILQYVRPSDFRETRLAVEIQKIRDANHSRETKPYEITNEGISVYRQANIF